MSIKFLAEDDRPREKFLLKGKNALSDSELLAIIMGSGSREESAVELARRIMQSVDYSFHELGKLTPKELMKFKGVGEAKAIAITEALEIGRRKAKQEVSERKIVRNSQDLFQLFSPYLSDLRTEEFWVTFVNQNNNVIHTLQLNSGGLTQSMVDIRVLFKAALDYGATALFVAHNHPSGNLEASKEDLEITKRIYQAGKLLNIHLLDHLIIGQVGYFSFADSGLL